VIYEGLTGVRVSKEWFTVLGAVLLWVRAVCNGRYGLYFGNGNSYSCLGARHESVERSGDIAPLIRNAETRCR
jgi:hypothetical protein